MKIKARRKTKSTACKTKLAELLARRLFRCGSQCLHLVFCSGLVTGSLHVEADDTEIFLSYSPSNPNVLIVLDTSTSMNEKLSVKEKFDSTNNYAGDCDPDRIYWKTHRQDLPTCDTDQWFLDARLRCSAARAALGYRDDGNGVGIYTDRITHYVSDEGKSGWYPLTPNVHEPVHVECRENQPDDGNTQIHGEGAGSSEPFISIDPATPYDSDSSWRYSDWAIKSQLTTLYSGNYLNWLHYHHVKRSATRMEVVKEVLDTLFRSTVGVNIGIMVFNRVGIDFETFEAVRGGSLIVPVKDIGGMDSNHRNALLDVLESPETDMFPGTPLADTLSEAYRIWTGMPYKFAHTRKFGSVGMDANGNYISPIDTGECSVNHRQIILTDGAPLDDKDGDFVNDIIGDFIREEGNSLFLSRESSKPYCINTNLSSSGDSCLDNLAELMNKANLRPNGNSEIRHSVRTSTIGFQIEDNSKASTLLQNAATHGGGEFYLAKEAQDLYSAFATVFNQAFEAGNSQTPPAAPVSSQNRLVHDGELYFGMFLPRNSDRWPGNVKRYQLKYDPDSGQNIIFDANDQPAIDSETARFKETAESWWKLQGDSNDGNDVEKGGLAHRLMDNGNDSGTRTGHVYTYVEDYGFEDFSGSGIGLVDLSENNSGPDKITSEHLGLEKTVAEDDLENYIKWARGVDVRDYDGDGNIAEGRSQMGAILHSGPSVVQFAKGGENDKPRNILLSMTNDGFLHVSETEGESSPRLEIFAFIPKPLLKNIPHLFHDAGSTPIYGLDGGLSVWVHDVDKNGTVEPEEGDHVYAYFGQRRGGRAIFALDISDLENPKLLWVIDPDSPEQRFTEENLSQHKNLGPFRHLGQSWAPPVRTRMRINTGSEIESKDVLIISGGYDAETQDVAGGIRRSEAGDSKGYSLYIIDAKTAELYWWTGRKTDDDNDKLKFNSAETEYMKYSIPAQVNVVDLNRDGFAEKFYVADTGGQVWRFDVNNALDLKYGPNISGGRIADVQKTSENDKPTAENNRRFYYPPDIAMVSLDPSRPYLTISIGSGYRAHPLDETVRDRFYLIRDYNIGGPPVNEHNEIEYTLLHENDLLDATSLDLGVVMLDEGEEQKLANGWLIKLPKSEKVLARSITFAGKAIFTTYTPSHDFDTETCKPDLGTGAIYAVRIDNAHPGYDLSPPLGDGVLELSDRKYTLKAKGIPPEPSPIFTDGLQVGKNLQNENYGTIQEGTEIPPILESMKPRPSYWYQEFENISGIEE